MNIVEEDYEPVFEQLTGMRTFLGTVDWVKNIAVEGTDYNDAYELLWDARESLMKRFDLEVEDDDLDAIMSAVLRIETEVARHMFHYGMGYAKRNPDK